LPARVTLLAAARYANSVKPFHSTPPRASFSLSACLAYLTARVAASRQPVLCDHRPILAGSVSSPTSQTPAFGMSGSRRERQLTGAAANSHSRPAADGPERLLPGPRRHGTCAGSEKPQPSSGASTVALGRSGNLRIRVSRPSPFDHRPTTRLRWASCHYCDRTPRKPAPLLGLGRRPPAAKGEVTTLVSHS
jgi:hypothetical protein